jgi:hypothetical protein
MATKIYEYVEGLNIDVPLIDSEKEAVPVASISAQSFFVLRPGSTTEEEWAAALVSPNILRHTVPEGADLLPGKYKIQPYIETVDGYKRRLRCGLQRG